MSRVIRRSLPFVVLLLLALALWRWILSRPPEPRTAPSQDEVVRHPSVSSPTPSLDSTPSPPRVVEMLAEVYRDRYPEGLALCPAGPFDEEGDIELDPDLVPEEVGLVARRATLTAGWIFLPVRNAEGSVVLHQEDIFGRIDWSDAVPGGIGQCTVTPVFTTGLFGRVVEEDGRPMATRTLVRGCGQRIRPEADGSFFMEITLDRCTLSAWRTNGWSVSKGEEVVVEGTPGQDLEVVLIAPPRPAWSGPPSMDREVLDELEDSFEEAIRARLDEVAAILVADPTDEKALRERQWLEQALEEGISPNQGLGASQEMVP